MVRNPAPFALAAKALPITSVLSARRAVSSVGSRIWVPAQSAHCARRGVTVSLAPPRPRTLRVRPCPYGRSRPVQRGQLIVPARRARSARAGQDTTITEDASAHVRTLAYHTPTGEGAGSCGARRSPPARRQCRAEHPDPRTAPTTPAATPGALARASWLACTVTTPTNAIT